jgi:hypothetical protein
MTDNTVAVSSKYLVWKTMMFRRLYWHKGQRLWLVMQALLVAISMQQRQRELQ